MTREQLVAMLGILVRLKRITLAEAQRFIARWDAGHIPLTSMPRAAGADETGGGGRNLPLVPLKDVFNAAVAIGFVAVLALLGVNYRSRVTRGLPIPKITRERLSDLIDDEFDPELRALVAIFFDKGDLAAFHQNIHDMLVNRVARNFMAGAGRRPNARERVQLQILIARRDAVLMRFMVEVAVKKENGLITAAQALTTKPAVIVTAPGKVKSRAISEKGMAARTMTYMAVSKEAFYRGVEASLGQAIGQVVYYDAVDDPHTCPACRAAAAASPYLPGNHPYPGSVCFGGVHCRCRLRYVYDLDSYNRLNNKQQAA